ncbi:MAG: TGS domain-containing protein, partial [Deltaproteobacteria bacterium]|nr:TGS domain-containing protein [Deltaproteobacteria bacterium]
MVDITFPDSNIKSFKKNSTGLDVAKGISDGFARNCVAMELDSEIVDLSTKITRDTKIRFITTKDTEALEILRHSAAHVMAQAILRLYPGARLTIGPAVEDGF